MFLLFLSWAMAHLWGLGRFGSTMVQAQGHGMMGGGMGGCPMCGQSWKKIPDKLPTPKSREWINELKEALSLEKLSLAQYETDSQKFQINMPYMMIMPQEENHITWISQLFSAYGIEPDSKVPPVAQSIRLRQAYEIAIKLESDLIPRYESLIRGSGDDDSAQVIKNILYQTRMHLMMFDHALRATTLG